MRLPANRAAAVPTSLQGIGIGLRADHYETIERTRPDVPWFEVLVDNYLGKGGSAWQHLDTIRRDYPVSFHGVGLSLGGSDPLDRRYLARLRQAIEVFEPLQISDHLCWTSSHGYHSHDLLPLPYTEETIHHVAGRIAEVQDCLGRPLLIENVSSYLQYRQSTLPEWEFLVAVAEQADCLILLDINNIHVSASNHGFDASRYLEGVPVTRVREMHLAGYEDHGSHLLDTHSRPVQPPVWELYDQALARFGPVPTLIEWDNAIPAFEVLHREAQRAQQRMDRVGRDAA
jgi:uncharacterized protein (UPF0276 family)